MRPHEQSAVTPNWSAFTLASGSSYEEVVEAVLSYYERHKGLRVPSAFVQIAERNDALALHENSHDQARKLAALFSDQFNDSAERLFSGIALLLHSSLPREVLQTAKIVLQSNSLLSTRNDTQLLRVASTIPGKFGPEGADAIDALIHSNVGSGASLPLGAEEEASWSLGQIGHVKGAAPVAIRLLSLLREHSASQAPYSDHIVRRLARDLLKMTPGNVERFTDSFAEAGENNEIYIGRLYWTRALSALTSAEHRGYLKGIVELESDLFAILEKVAKNEPAEPIRRQLESILYRARS